MLYCFSVLVEYFKYHALVLLLNSVFRLNSCELSINISVDLPDNCAKSVLFCGVHNLTPGNRNHLLMSYQQFLWVSLVLVVKQLSLRLFRV